MKVLLSVVFCFFAFSLLAQLPETDVWLFTLKADKNGKLTLYKGTNISNRKGYDNQAAFSADAKKLFYSSVRDSSRADIYVADTKSYKSGLLVKGNISVYSPQPYGKDNISGVTVEKDSAQRICFYSLINGQARGCLEFDSVGYYTFINTDTVVYYKLTQPHSLRYHVISSREDKFICDQPTRSILAVNRHAVVFARKDSISTTFYNYDFLLRKAQPICTIDLLAEDACWDEKFGLMRSFDNKLLYYDSQTKAWLQLFDFSGFGIKKIARFKLDSKHKLLSVVQAEGS